MTTLPDRLDPEAIERLDRLGGDGFIVRIVDVFLEDAPTRMAAAREAVAADDLAGLAAAVHALGSSSANLGATALSDLAREMERQAYAKERRALDRMPALEDAFQRACGLLAELRRERA